MTPEEERSLLAEVDRLRAFIASGVTERLRVVASRVENERDLALAAIARVRALHAGAGDDLGNFCRCCGHGYPCATIRALDGVQ